jgi:hypothetical protein
MEGRPMGEPVTDLQLASDATPSTVEAAAGTGNPVAVYLARLTSPESRRAMATSLKLLAEILVDGHPADRTERARRRRAGQPLAAAVPWHELRYGHTQALRSTTTSIPTRRSRTRTGTVSTTRRSAITEPSH